MPSHTIPPIYDENSKVLILGSFPSVSSREAAFFYAHPQNRFWRVLAAVTESALPETTEEKKRLLLKNGIALWDVIASCDIEGSSDTSISAVTPNDLSEILAAAPIERIFTNGGKASELYKKYLLPKTGIPATSLPSTSPANAGWSFERLLTRWREILPD